MAADQFMDIDRRVRGIHGIRRRSLASLPKPTGDTQAVAASGQHRVFAPLSQKADQPPRDGLDIARLIAVEDPQLTAGIRSPRVIEIQHQRNLSLIAPLRLIDVTSVARTGCVPSIVKLKIE